MEIASESCRSSSLDLLIRAIAAQDRDDQRFHVPVLAGESTREVRAKISTSDLSSDSNDAVKETITLNCEFIERVK